MKGYLADQPFIPAHHQPAELIDLIQDQGIDLNRLLRHTGLFHEQILSGEACFSPRTWLQLIHNARRLQPDPELSFRYGQRLFPGHYGSVSALLANAGNLGEALQVFRDFSRLILPLLGVRLTVTDKHVCLHWLPSTGYRSEHRFVVEAAMTALASVTRWLSETRLPWAFQFSYPQPGHPEHYEVYLGGPLHFDAHIDAMILPRQYLERPWPQASSTIRLPALRQCQQQLEGGSGDSLRLCLYRHLQKNLADAPSLPRVADLLRCSPATLKRRLKDEGCHFQQLLDEVRLHQAIHWFQFEGYSTEQVAKGLNFNDNTNFRRSFKRWAGVTPAMCLKQLVVGD
ncbi:AraC family transcriptional regulator [Alloalcanivorax venustensis]|jgi:AraC-like DNA-binding protein|uniref:AraC family transcriptional regulator n=1 Tax=Alloalcanivorax venustensis TaxID=172371 RepID=UPI003C519027